MKRLIVLCDGTGNSATGAGFALATNVSRLCDVLSQTFSSIEPYNCNEEGSPKSCNKCPCTKTVMRPQLTFYQSGVGTSTGMSDISKTLASGTGAGIDDKILDAYHFLATNHEVGDEIFIFGFSRGAFTARIVANLVAQLGLFKKDRLWMMRKAWLQYLKNDGQVSFKYFLEKFYKTDAQRDAKRVTVKVLGVWDTVDSVGLPDYMESGLKVLPETVQHWANVRDCYKPDLVYGIENAFHALAIDEYRRTFNPTLFFMPDPATRNDPVTGEKRPLINLKQCWFPGVHSNIGGSYPSEHIADLTLGWMIDQCMKAGNLLQFEDKALQKIIRLHASPEERKDSYHVGGDQKYPGYGCGTIYDSYKGKMTKFLTWQYRSPGNYCEPGEHRGQAGTRGIPTLPGWPKWVPYFGREKPLESDFCTECDHPGNPIPETGALPVEGATNETIHASVYARYQASIKLTSDQIKQLKKVEELEIYNDYRKKNKQDHVYAVSLVNWDPEALAAFREEHPKEGGRYRREYDEKTKAFIWKGRCLKTGKFFYMWEEPDTAAKDTPVSAKMVAQLKEAKPFVRRPENPAATNARMDAHKYLEENFNVPKDEVEERREQQRVEAEEKRQKRAAARVMNVMKANGQAANGQVSNGNTANGHTTVL